MVRYREESYNLLNGEDEDGLKDNDAKVERRPKGLSRAIVVALVAFVVLDIFAYVYIAKVLLWLPLPNNPGEMEFRNPYYGLDDLYHAGIVNTSQYPKLLNAPRFAAQVDSRDPDKVSQIDPHRWLSDFGLLSPPDRRLQVSSTIHTILHFSVLDYGMEKCSLAVRLPTAGETLPHPHSVQDTNGLVRLAICRSENRRNLDERKLSWNTRPSCVQSMGTILARVGGEVELPSFPCKSGDFLTFEVSCSDETPNCGVDVWSNQNATWGMFMYQYQTV